MVEDSLHRLSLDAVIQGCRTEAQQPRAQEIGYCFELFRRAVEDQEQGAWTAIDEQYRHLIVRWIYDHSSELPAEDIEQIAPETLPRFWQALSRSALPLTPLQTHRSHP